MAFDFEELRKLPAAAKLRIVEQLWDDIASSDDPFLFQPWHENEATRRSEELDRNPDISLTREQVWARVTKNPEP